MRLVEVNRLLAGILTALCVLRCQLPVSGQSDPPRDIGTYPLPCSHSLPGPDFISRLGVQYLNSGISTLSVFATHTAALDESGSARFRIWGLSDDPRACSDFTTAYGSSDKYNWVKLRVRLHPAEPLYGRRAGLQLVESPTGPYLRYIPTRHWGPHTETLTFRLTVRHPTTTYAANFNLDVPGLEAGSLIPLGLAAQASH